mmetsp:Transcript_9473/g.18282  ORF Transcript_9473/g.18282 Transcript_9473/m.18282 type:complete len:186 (-) Transcript_9473:4076-4633(-)
MKAGTEDRKERHMQVLQALKEHSSSLMLDLMDAEEAKLKVSHAADEAVRRLRLSIEEDSAKSSGVLSRVEVDRRESVGLEAQYAELKKECEVLTDACLNIKPSTSREQQLSRLSTLQAEFNASLRELQILKQSFQLFEKITLTHFTAGEKIVPLKASLAKRFEEAAMRENTFYEVNSFWELLDEL